jgi:hypothetical protein
MRTPAKDVATARRDLSDGAVDLVLQRVACIVVAGLAACGTAPTADYQPPRPTTVHSSRRVDLSYEATWAALVNKLASQGFAVAHADRQAGVIHLSFSTHKPSDYVDCGTTRRSARAGDHDADGVYRTADSASFNSTDRNGHAYNVRRSTRLDAKAGIAVARIGQATLLTVQASYRVIVNVSAVALDGRPETSGEVVFDLSTSRPFVSADVQCHATGAFEQRILSMVSG